MKTRYKTIKIVAAVILLLIVSLTTSIEVNAYRYTWKGGHNQNGNIPNPQTHWHFAQNWDPEQGAPLRVPGPDDDVFIQGNTTYQPRVYDWSIITIKSLTIGTNGYAASLYLSCQSFTVKGNVLIGSQGTFENNGTSAYYEGNFVVNGSYRESAYAENNGNSDSNKFWAVSTFNGTNEIEFTNPVSGAGLSFGIIHVNGILNLKSNLNLTATVSYMFNDATTIRAVKAPELIIRNGAIVNPSVYRINFQTANPKPSDGNLIPIFSIQTGGTVRVKATTFKGNYSHWPTTIQTNATIEYVAPTVVSAFGEGSAYNQTIYAPIGTETAVPYKNLKMSGGGVRDMSGSIVVDEEIDLASGRIETGDNYKITLGSTNGRIKLEDGTNYITGKVETSRLLGVGLARAFGNTGITITSQVDGGLTKITRVTGKPIKDYANAPTLNKRSILRHYTVEPAMNNGSLNAVIQLKYLDHELNGFTKGELFGYYSELFWDEAAWNYYWKSTPQETLNQVTLTDIRSLGRYTLGVGSPNPFPVEMISFTATRKGSNAVLNWAVTSEENNSGFEVQASTDGKDYQKIGFVKSRVGTTSIRQEYSFTDNRSNKYGTVYYRLKQIDLDGKASLYGPRDVSFGRVATTTLKAYPNPVEDELTILITAKQSGTASITLHDMMGKVWLEKENEVNAGKTELTDNIDRELPSGIYMLTVKLNEDVQVTKLVKR